MKKILLVSFLTVLALTLAACMDGSSPTAAGVAVLEPQSTETNTPESPTDTPQPPARPAETKDNTAILATGGPSAETYHLKALMDFEVKDMHHNVFGTVRDLVVNTDTGNIQYVILRAGGFLGVGEKDLAVPFSALVLDPRITERFMISNLPADLLKNAPEIDLAAADLNQAGWDQAIASYWSKALTPAPEPAGPGTPAATKTAVRATAAKPAVKTGTPVPGSRAVSNFLASRLFGARVTGALEEPAGSGTARVKTIMPLSQTQTAVGKNPLKTPAGAGGKGTAMPFAGMTGEDLGIAEDALIDPATGQVEYVLIAARPALNIGDKVVPAPLIDLVIVSEGEQNVVAAVPDVARLRNAPNYEPSALPDITQPGWDANIRGYWFIK